MVRFVQAVFGQRAQGGISLRNALLRLILITLLPLALASGLIAWQLWMAQESLAEDNMRDTATALSLAVDREISGVRGQLEAIAQSRMVDEERWEELHGFLRTIAEARHGAVVALVDRTGQLKVQSNFQFGARLPNLWELEGKHEQGEWEGQRLPVSSQGLTRSVIETGAPAVSSLYLSMVARHPVIGLSVPVIRDGHVRYAVVYSFPTASLERLLGDTNSTPLRLALIDQKGIVIAKSASSPEQVGARGDLGSVGRQPPKEKWWIVQRVAADGVSVLSALASSDVTGWTVRVSQPAADALAPAYRAAVSWTALFAIVLLIATGSAVVLSGRLASPLVELARSAGGDAAPRKGATGIRELDVLTERLGRAAESEEQRRVERDRRIAAEERERAAAESERIVREREQELRIALDARRRSEEALQQSEEQFRQITDHVNDVFWITDHPSRQLRYVSPAFERLWELSRAAIFADPNFYPSLIHPEDRARAEAAYLEDAEHGRFDIEYRLLCPDGERWIHDRCFPLRDAEGQVFRMVGVAQDITARKRDEADLAHLAFVVESVDDGIVSLDIDGRVRTWNPAAERIYGLTASEALGQFLQDLVEPPEAHTFPELLAMVKRGVPVHDTEGVHRRRDGTRLTVSLALALILVGDEVTGVAATIRDVSARKLYERKLRQHLADLEEADRRKDHFLAMLGHELRNPLSPIMNSAQLIRHAGSDRVLVERSTTVIERQVEHLTRLIDDLLDVARITEGKIVLKRERRDLMPLLYQALEATRAMIEARNQRLVIETPTSAVDLEADPVRLVQVFTNLLTNATKYTPEGGEIHLTAVREGDAAVIRIRDNGLGIAPEMLPRLFVPFSQASEALDRAQGGLGIGLALVKRLVEMHGGTVAADSGGRGRGSEFTVTLPLVSNVPLAARDDPAPRAAGSAPSLDCLVVDDNVDAADSLAALLQASGHRTVVCYEGASALRAIDHSAPQLAILDIGLPGMDGYELARRIRTGENGRRIFLAALTGYGQPSDAERAREAGFDMHLVKPLLPDVLGHLVARVADAHQGPTRADIQRVA